MANKRIRNRFNSNKLLELHKKSIWRCVLSKVRGFGRFDINELWFDYMRGVDLGYFEDKHIEQIKKHLKIPSDDELNEIMDKRDHDAVNKYFERDISELTKINSILQLLKDVGEYEDLYYLLFRFDSTFIFIKQLYLNLDMIKDYYFSWNVERFEDPLDNYEWLQNNYIFLLKILKMDLEHLMDETKDDGFYNAIIFEKIAELLKNMCNNIYRAGQQHKFSL